MRANPEILNLLQVPSDIFIYAESCLKKPPPSPLPGYDLMLHPAKINSHRRGLVVLFLRKYRYSLSKDYASSKFDILWIRLKNKIGEIIFCTFYAPGQNHSESERMKFYDELRSGCDRYIKGEKIFLIGDTNARLGSYSLDRDIHGEFQSNKNKSIFLSFLNYTGLIYLNRRFCKGVPTYEIYGKRKSIIDVCLTNDIGSIHTFEILPNIIGVRPQTSHRVLKLVISQSLEISEKTNLKVTNCDSKPIRSFNEITQV